LTLSGGISTAANSTVTAASSSGTTATLTVANTFVVGDIISVAGMTPFGYNGAFTVVTASSTQITYTTAGSSIGAGTVFGTVSIAQTLTFSTATGGITVNTAAITGGGAITKEGTGTLTLGINNNGTIVANTYTGTTNVNNGILLSVANGALGTIAGGTSGTIVANNATLQFNAAYTTAEPISASAPASAALAPSAASPITSRSQRRSRSPGIPPSATAPQARR